MEAVKNFDDVAVTLVGNIFNESNPATDSITNNIRFFKTGKAIYKIDLSAIDYVLAYGNYSKLYMATKQLVVGVPLKDIEEKLGEKEFVRIHRSCIVSIRKIEKVMENTVYISNINLAVGKQYRDFFYEKIFNFG